MISWCFARQRAQVQDPTTHSLITDNMDSLSRVDLHSPSLPPFARNSRSRISYKDRLVMRVIFPSYLHGSFNIESHHLLFQADVDEHCLTVLYTRACRDRCVIRPCAYKDPAIVTSYTLDGENDDDGERGANKGHSSDSPRRFTSGYRVRDHHVRSRVREDTYTPRSNRPRRYCMYRGHGSSSPRAALASATVSFISRRHSASTSRDLLPFHSRTGYHSSVPRPGCHVLVGDIGMHRRLIKSCL